MDKAIEVEVVKRIEECLKLLGMSQCVFVVAREGKDVSTALFTYNTNPITILGMSKYLEQIGSSQMTQQMLKAAIEQTLEEKEIQKNPDQKHTVIH